MDKRRNFIRSIVVGTIGSISGCLNGNNSTTSSGNSQNTNSQGLPDDLSCDDHRPDIPDAGDFCSSGTKDTSTVITYNVDTTQDPLDVENWGSSNSNVLFWGKVSVHVNEKNIAVENLFNLTSIKYSDNSETGNKSPDGITVPVGPNQNVGTDGSLTNFEGILIGEDGFATSSTLYFGFEKEVSGLTWDVNTLLNNVRGLYIS